MPAREGTEVAEGGVGGGCRREGEKGRNDGCGEGI